MLRTVLLFACVVACSTHAILPLTHSVPALHTAVAPVAPVTPYLHGYAGHGLSGYGSYGLLGHGFGVQPYGHHVLKRSPHYVSPVVGHYGHHYGHVAPVAAVAPVAVSHQSRVDLHASPAVVAAPALLSVKPVVAPLLHSASLPLTAGPFPYGHGIGHYGSAYSHLGHY